MRRVLHTSARRDDAASADVYRDATRDVISVCDVYRDATRDAPCVKRVSGDISVLIVSLFSSTTHIVTAHSEAALFQQRFNRIEVDLLQRIGRGQTWADWAGSDQGGLGGVRPGRIGRGQTWADWAGSDLGGLGEVRPGQIGRGQTWADWAGVGPGRIGWGSDLSGLGEGQTWADWAGVRPEQIG